MSKQIETETETWTPDQASAWLARVGDALDLHLPRTDTPIPVVFRDLGPDIGGQYSPGADEVAIDLEWLRKPMTPGRQGRLLGVYLHECAHLLTHQSAHMAPRTDSHDPSFGLLSLILHWRAAATGTTAIPDDLLPRAAKTAVWNHATITAYDWQAASEIYPDGRTTSARCFTRLGHWVQRMTEAGGLLVDTDLTPEELAAECVEIYRDWTLDQHRPRHWLARRIRRAASRPDADLLLELATVLLGGAALGVVGMAGFAAVFG